MSKFLALRSKTTQEIIGFDELCDTGGNDIHGPALAYAEHDGWSGLEGILQAATIFVETKNYEVVELEINLIVVKIVGSLDDLLDED